MNVFLNAAHGDLWRGTLGCVFIFGVFILSRLLSDSNFINADMFELVTATILVRSMNLPFLWAMKLLLIVHQELLSVVINLVFLALALRINIQNHMVTRVH